MDSTKSQSYITKSGAQEVNPFSGAEVVCLYFSAHWCPPCRNFTPVLAQFYNDVNVASHKLEIIFVSSDKDKDQFQHYYDTMPWIALPYGDPRVAELKQKHQITGIPSLIVLKPDGSVISTQGRAEVSQHGPKAFDNWAASAK